MPLEVVGVEGIGEIGPGDDVAAIISAAADVRDGDVVVVPYGYHPFAAAPGHDFYYLNALAGDRRSMASSDDPELAWIRSSWEHLEPDPRVPLVS